MSSTTVTIRRIGESAGECFTTIPSDFFNELVTVMYPRNLHRRKWALINLELFYNNRRQEIETMQEIRNEQQR